MKSWFMQRKVRLSLLVLLGAVLAGIAAVAWIGKDKEEQVGFIGTAGPSVTNGVIPEGKKLPKRKTYPAGEWDIAVPYLNPFGAQLNYASVKQTPNQTQEIRYIDPHYRETARMTSGEVWQLQVDWKDQKVDPFSDLQQYMSELGGEFYRGSKEGSWVMHAKDGAGDDWWGIASKNGSGYLLIVYKELKLKHGQTVTFRTDEFGGRELYFMTDNPNHSYQSIRVALSEGKAQLAGKGAYEQGQYRRELQYSQTLDTVKTTQYTLNDIPQDSSVPVLWKVTWTAESDPKEIRFTLDEAGKLEPIRDGERLGALKIRGNHLGNIKVQAPPGVTVRHPELQLKGDRTPEGDTLFWLPAGYWNVEIQQGGDKYNRTTLNTRLVPVSSGEMTTMELKPLFNQAYQKTEIGTAEGGERQLKIESVGEQGQQATVSFMLLDAQAPQLTPDLSDIDVTEGGRPGKIVKLDRLAAPPSVVLALDSSGSMDGAMEEVLAAARSFIDGLPEQTHIQVIDFDSEVRLLEGSDKATVLDSLSRVKAQGSTRLYDSVVQGIDLLNGKERPTMVVFTDGVDSSADKQGTGSKATKQEAEQAVKASGIPLFTIGFGPDHDRDTMLELAAMSEGTYYSAEDSEALNRVFGSINGRLGNHFELVYERPKEQSPSDIPVISLTLDVSGSMDVDPASGNGDYRIDKMKHLYHDFIGRLPEQSLVQLVSFSSEVKVNQAFTQSKPELLQSLGGLAAGGGTDIFASADMTYRSLKQIPSDKRVAVYLTDAALDVEQDRKQDFEELLTGMKQDGVQVLWVGLGTGESEEAFRWAAEKSGGRYVISEDPDVLAQAFMEVLAEVQSRPAENISLSLSVAHDPGDGRVQRYSDSRLVDFPAVLNPDDRVTMNTIAYETGARIAQYEQQTAALVYGRDLPGETVQISKRMPLSGAAGKNQAMEWTAREMIFMKRFKGVDAPHNRSFVAVDTELRNIHPDRAKVLIPDFAAHFFVSVNNAGSYPASTATWLAETPLAPPGEGAVLVKPDEPVRGTLVFLVPDEEIRQASLHYYDTANGHMTLSLVGEAQNDDIAVASLPTSLSGRLSDAFDMTITGSSQLDKIGNIELKRGAAQFQVIEAELKSNVQADMKLDPRERFYMQIQTEAGPFLVPVHTATALLPHGLLRPVTWGPGSVNKARLAFQLPSVLRERPMDVYVDLFGGATVLPLTGDGGSSSGGGAGQSGGPVYEGDGITLTVNALARTKTIDNSSGNYVVADVTFTDAQDQQGTSGLRESFRLVPTGQPADQETKPLTPDAITDELLLGMSREWAVFDGTSRRGLLVFAIPHNQAGQSWELQSVHFSSLKLPVGGESYASEGLLVKQTMVELDSKFDLQLSAALADAISRHKTASAAQASEQGATLADLDAGGGKRHGVPAVLPTAHGLARLQAVNNWADFQALMSSLRWLPSPDAYNRYRNAPESVLTQGWGTEGDLANLAGGLLAKLGYSPALRMVQLTEEGRKALHELGKTDEVKQNHLPAWAFTDEQGNARVFVVPFMKDLSELGGRVFYPGGQERRTMTPLESTITVYYKVRPLETSGQNAVTGDIAGALGGGGAEGEAAIQDVRMLNASIALDRLGAEAIDIRVGGADGLYTAVLENRALQMMGSQTVDPAKNKIVGVRIEVQLPHNKLVHETSLRDDEDITGLFHTLVIHIPDLPADAASALEKAAEREYKAAAKPDDHSALAWYTRGVLYRLIASQTAYEAGLAAELGVTAGRTNQERVMVVTVRADEQGTALRTSVDLQQSANQLHKGEEEARIAFQVMSGVFASRLEGAVLPGDHADFLTLWANSPDDTRLWLSLPIHRKNDLQLMKEQGLPELLLKRAEKSSAALLIPTQPTAIHGEKRWAWLEIDPATYETIAVTDTGEHGSFAEYLIGLERVSPTGDDYLAFMAGAFIGVSSSVWSVASYSLELDDYEEIIKAAKLFTIGLGDALGGMMDQKDYPKLEYSMSPIKLKLTDQNFDYLAKRFEDVKLGKKPDGSADIVGFASGFKAGVAYYFKHASPK